MAQPKTGPMNFEGELTGVYIRATDAKRFASKLRQVVATYDEGDLVELAEILESRSDMSKVQEMLNYYDCLEKSQGN